MTLLSINHQPAFANTIEQLLNSQGRASAGCTPSVNIYGSDDSFMIEMAVPGYSKEDFSINLEQQTLKVTAAAKENEIKEEKFLRHEFSFHGISRKFTLPKNADTDNISADYQNGLLKIKIPVKQETILKKEISIS